MNNILPYQLIRSRRRTLSLTITQDATLVVRAPMRLNMGVIHDFIKRKQPWVLRKMDEMRRRPRTQLRRFVPGEKFLFLGQPHELVHSLESQKNPRAQMVAWFREQAEKIIIERCQHLAAHTGLHPRKIRISHASSRWGSCSARKTVSFSWRLVMAPIEVIDYVIIHELVHLSEMNHSHRFWSKVASLMPDYKQHNKWLKDHGSMMTL